tara:strand:- start:93 stop:302 length:210 start_codon:yes stop_codon:yes gene_type:complete
MTKKVKEIKHCDKCGLWPEQDEVEVHGGDGKDLLVEIHFADGYVYEGWVNRISVPADEACETDIITTPR